MAGAFEFAHVIAVGRVQGVGFREFTLRAAQAHHATGFVRNLSDGTVEARLIASPQALEALLDDLRRGPPHARVAELRILKRGASQPEGEFRVAATL